MRAKISTNKAFFCTEQMTGKIFGFHFFGWATKRKKYCFYRFCPLPQIIQIHAVIQILSQRAKSYRRISTDLFPPPSCSWSIKMAHPKSHLESDLESFWNPGHSLLPLGPASISWNSLTKQAVHFASRPAWTRQSYWKLLSCDNWDHTPRDGSLVKHCKHCCQRC